MVHYLFMDFKHSIADRIFQIPSSCHGIVVSSCIRQRHVAMQLHIVYLFTILTRIRYKQSSFPNKLCLNDELNRLFKEIIKEDSSSC